MKVNQDFITGQYNAFKQRYDLLFETINSNASILSIRLEGLAGDNVPHYFVIDIPVGRTLYLFNRDLTLSQGRYFIDAIAVDTVDMTGAITAAKAPLNKTQTNVVDTDLKYTDGPVTGAVVREFGFLDTGEAIGSGRASGTTGQEGLIKVLNGPSVLRVTKTTTGTFTANLVYIFWEDEV